MIHNVFRVSPTSTSFPRFINPWSGEDDGTGLGASGPYLFYTPRDITLYDGCLARATAPGASNTLRTEYILGTEGGTQTGADVDLVDPATSVRSAITGTWTTSTAATTGAGRHIALRAEPAATLDDTQITFVYQDTTISGLSWYGFGDRVANLLSGVTATNDRFTSAGVSDAVAATESFVQVPWPAAGTFQYVGASYIVGTGTGDVTLVLRINGADTAITFTLSDTAGIATLLTDSVLTASVAAGDLVSWRMQQASGANFSCTLIWGFVAS